MSNQYWKTDNIVYIGDPFGDAQELTESEYNQLYLEEQIKDEIASLKAYLSSTDYIYPKCLELGLDVNTEYESMVQDRKTARARIQELEGV